MRLSRSELDEDAVYCVEVITHKLIPQLPEKGSLLLGETFSIRWLIVVVVSLYNPNSSAKAATYSFNRVRTHEYCYIPADGCIGDVKLVCQIVTSVMPSKA